ncbi:hypothetical protein LG329_16230 [Virgibacillus necropolis]|uniref:hypothetical protein n=1 Tax=Virgibacillus necropolis TaxID=163877 RepID=UPI00384C7119
MNNNNLRNLIMTILLAVIGILVFIISVIESEKLPFGVGALGIALAGISIEVYLKSKNDTKNEKGEKRNEIEKYDERNVLINAKSGETVNFVMDVAIFIAFCLAIYLNISIVGQTLIFSLLVIRMIIRPIVKRYYEKQI